MKKVKKYNINKKSLINIIILISPNYQKIEIPININIKIIWSLVIYFSASK